MKARIKLSACRSALPEVCVSDSVFGHTTLGGLLPDAIPICGVLGDSHVPLLGLRRRLRGWNNAVRQDLHHT